MDLLSGNQPGNAPAEPTTEPGPTNEPGASQDMTGGLGSFAATSTEDATVAESTSDEEITRIAESQKAKPLPKTFDEKGLLVVEVSPGKIAKLKELDGFQSLRADTMIGANTTPLIIYKIYALFGLSSLVENGQEVTLPPAKDDQQIYRRSALFSARELLILMASYEDAFMGDPMAGAQLKNSPTPAS